MTTKWFRFCLLATVASPTVLGLHQPLSADDAEQIVAQAQDESADDADTAAPVAEPGFEEDLVITGSRIATDSALDAPAPVLTIDGDDLATSGNTDITALLRETPALQGSLPGSFSAFNAADTEDSDLGAGFANLRSLGIERTLVLVNGRRHVPGTSGQAAVDLNTIPVSMLRRVDVQTGGASSIYGADAVSGVVNFIMRDPSDFDGLEVQAQGGLTDDGDAEEAFLSVATGFEFANGRGSAVVGVEYSRTEAVFASDRDFAGSGQANQVPMSDDVAEAFGLDPNASNAFVPNTTLPVSSSLGVISFFGSSFGEVASLESREIPTIGDTGIPTLQVFDDGNLRAYNPGDIFIDPFNAVGGDAIPTDPDLELILPERDDVIVSAHSTYEVTPFAKFFVEAKFAFSDTIDSVQVNGFNDDIPIALDNPFIPAALQTQIDTLQATGETVNLVMSRDTFDFVPIPNAERTLFRIVGGLEGEVIDGLSYEVSYNYGRTQVNVTNGNTRIEDRFFASVDAVRDPDTGEIVCRSDLDPDAVPPVSPFPMPRTGFLTFDPGDGQCEPTSLFGENAINEEAGDFIFVDTISETTVTQESFLAIISGDSDAYFSIPFGGPIGYAGGFEYRKERSEFTPDPLNTAGLTFGATSGGPTFPSSGEVQVYEGFFETQLPLLRDLPGVDILEFTGSVRISDYDTIGSTTTWAVGGRYGPHPSFTFRATYAEAVRAPNIGELFSPQQPASLGADEDPCNPQFIDAGTEFREQNCLQLVGEGFNSTDFNSAFVPGVSGGNPSLNEEEAQTLTAGFVFNPEFLSGLLITADFYDIEITGAIDDLSAFDIAQACVDLPSLDNQFCNQIVRDPVNGSINSFESGQINLGALETRGLDFTTSYDFAIPEIADIGDLGNLRLAAVGTRFLRYNEFQDPVDQSVFEDQLGTFTLPKWIINFNADWTFRDLGVGWRGRFESSQLLPGIDNADLESNPDFVDPSETGSSFVHDIVADYRVTDTIEVYGGVNNLLDRDPYIGTLSRPAGPRGRFFFLGLTYRG